jgi:Pyruvate/2-oxoacid:ferredoxin oxidoreductase delta subunit
MPGVQGVGRAHAILRDGQSRSSQAMSEAAVQEAKKPARKAAKKKKRPVQLAVVDQSGCTGCEACIVFCPVDCIEIVPNEPHADLNKLVEIDLARCIGCTLCAQYCPWETIEMIATEEALSVAPERTIRTLCYPDGLWPSLEDL